MMMDVFDVEVLVERYAVVGDAAGVEDDRPSHEVLHGAEFVRDQQNRMFFGPQRPERGGEDLLMLEVDPRDRLVQN